MPLLSSLLGHNAPSPPLHLVFHPANEQGIIRTTTAQDQEVALFSVSNNVLVRLRPTHEQVCTFKRSSLSGDTTLTFPNQRIKLHGILEGYTVENSIDMDSPLGKLKWRPGSGGYMELRDGRKALLARGQIHGTIDIRPSNLEVYVAGDVFLLDLILASWVSMYKGQETSPEDLKAVADIADALSAALGN